jgi:hypothetical protein
MTARFDRGLPFNSKEQWSFRRSKGRHAFTRSTVPHAVFGAAIGFCRWDIGGHHIVLRLRLVYCLDERRFGPCTHSAREFSERRRPRPA